MAELKQLISGSQQLMSKLPAMSRSHDIKSDTTTRRSHCLPVVSSRHLDINIYKGKIWNHGTWGVVPVQIKKLTGVNIDSIRKKQNTEINILRAGYLAHRLQLRVKKRHAGSCVSHRKRFSIPTHASCTHSSIALAS